MKNLLILLAIILGSISSVYAQYAVKAEKIYTMDGKMIENGVILIKDGKIQDVGLDSKINIPSDYVIKEAKYVTPGLVDARSVVGLAGALNQPHDQDQLETSYALQPELRAIDAYNPHDILVSFLKKHGVTTVNTGHGHGAVSTGQTMTIKTVGNTVEEALLDSMTMVVFNLGPVSREFKTPGTRGKSVAMLRSAFLEAQEYAKKMSGPADKRPARDLRKEAMAKVLSKEVPALIRANHANDIMTALRLQKEFGFELILDGAAEAYLVMDEIKAARIPVIIHPSMVRTGGDTQNASLETAAKLKKAGITVVLQSSFEGYVPKTRVVLFEAAILAANGMSFEEALATITIDAAKVLGQDKRIGSIKKGKDADLALFDGDPFEYTTRVCGVFIDGELVSEECN